MHNMDPWDVETVEKTRAYNATNPTIKVEIFQMRIQLQFTLELLVAGPAVVVGCIPNVMSSAGFRRDEVSVAFIAMVHRDGRRALKGPV